jgi:hypothetical protein
VLDDEGAGEVDDLNRLAGVEDADPVAAERASDAELDATELDRSAVLHHLHPDVVGDGWRRGRCGGPGRLDGGCRVLRLLWCDPSGQCLMGTLGVVNGVERVDLVL